MELSEEKQLKHITEEFTKGVGLFRERQCQQALETFNRIVEEYKDSQYYSVLEMQGRSKLYRKLCEARLNPVKVKLQDDEDYLFDGILHLNAGKPDKALERFNYLEGKKNNDPYLNYLISLVYLKKGDYQASLKYLHMAINADEYYRIIAYNEPDFEFLFENEKFTNMIEMENGNES